jgi:hypothetical protein
MHKKAKKAVKPKRSRKSPKFVTDAQIVAQLKKTYGCITIAAGNLGITARCLTARIAASDELQLARDESREAMVDLAENQLAKQIKKGDTTAIIFALKTRGKQRGYIEKIEHDHSGAVDMRVVGVLMHKVLGEIQEDDRWLDYARESTQDRYAGVLRDGGQRGRVADGPASPGDRPGNHGHDPRSKRKDTGG